MEGEKTRRQLALIHELTALLSAAAIPHWLAGGWAIDFHVGHVTRDHHDVDWSIWRTDQDAVAALVQQAGYEPKPVRFPDEKCQFTKAGEDASFFFLARNENGAVITPGRYAWWPWPEGSFQEGRVAELDGIVCPVISVEGQLDAKVNQPGGPQREKDHADIAHLRRLLEIAAGVTGG